MRKRIFLFLEFSLSLLSCFGATGCSWDQLSWDQVSQLSFVKGPKPPPPPLDSFVLRGDNLEAQKTPEIGTPEADLAGAKELFRQTEYSKAEKVFHRLAENSHNASALAEEARFFEAECLRLEGNLPRASDTYIRMLNDFPSGAFRDQAVHHLFSIANLWLDDTRKEMVETRELREGKRWIVWPHFVHFDQGSPLLDKEGRALEVLEQVRYNDMNGPLADKALFLSGSVKFFNEDYKDSDLQFTQLVEMYPNSKFAQQAIELAIISKHMSTGGADYDGRKVAEARQMVHTAARNYPELAQQKADFLERQLKGIQLQQAEKDFKVADFYERTDHPGPAYFCYQIVRQRYPNTKFSDLATERMLTLKAKLEKSNQKDVDPPMEGLSKAPPPPRSRQKPADPNGDPVPNNPAPPDPEKTPEPRKLPEPLIRN